jgi:hypothetical protein
MAYLKHSWCHPALIVKKSKINGRGIFTTKPIKKGDKVMIFGGEIVGKEETDGTKYREMSFFPIGDDKLLASTTETKDEYLNHSCDPNTWLIGEVTVVARQNIKAEEEITMDSATWDCDDDWTYTETGQCTCGSKACRRTLSPNDWKIPALQKKYKGHFAPYIQAKIDARK